MIINNRPSRTTIAKTTNKGHLFIKGYIETLLIVTLQIEVPKITDDEIKKDLTPPSPRASKKVIIESGILLSL